MPHVVRKYEVNPAIRKETPLRLSIFAPPGSGKTYSALRLARGIQRVYPGKIVLIDTEAGRALHYADKFEFEHMPFSPPFGSLDYVDAIRQAFEVKPLSCVIVDSMSHEHVGEGGYLMEHERWIDVMAGTQKDDYKRREQLSQAAWARVAPLRTQMIQALLQLRGNIIFTFRAKETTKPVKKPGSDKVEIVDQGFKPQSGDEILFEQTASCLLLPRSGGVASWNDLLPSEKLMTKLPEQFLKILDTGKPLDEETGEQIARWAKGDANARAAAPSPPVRPEGAPEAWEAWSTEERGEWCATKGSKVLREWWESIPKGPAKVALAPKLENWKITAQTVDQTAG